MNYVKLIRLWLTTKPENKATVTYDTVDYALHLVQKQPTIVMIRVLSKDSLYQLSEGAAGTLWSSNIIPKEEKDLAMFALELDNA